MIVTFVFASKTIINYFIKKKNTFSLFYLLSIINSKVTPLKGKVLGLHSDTILPSLPFNIDIWQKKNYNIKIDDVKKWKKFQINFYLRKKS